MDIEEINVLNDKYILTCNDITTLDQFFKATNEFLCTANTPYAQINYIDKSLINLLESTTLSPLISDLQKWAHKYSLFIQSISHLESALLNNFSSKDLSDEAIKEILNCNKEYQVHTAYIKEKYNLNINSEKSFIESIRENIEIEISKFQTYALSLRKEASKIWTEHVDLELSHNSPKEPAKSLPEYIVLAKYQTNSKLPRIMIDEGYQINYNFIKQDMHKQGNTIVYCPLENISDTSLDSFILAYIFKCLEKFPIGSINIHIFGKNISGLYTRLKNCFSDDNANENTRNIIQMHSDLKEMEKFRDGNCSDIFKKTSEEKPDLYSLFDTDNSDTFNLVVIRTDIFNGENYYLNDSLDLINLLSNTGEIGHKCGFRFLIIKADNSTESHYERNQRIKISSIEKNCSVKLYYSSGHFRDGKGKIEALHIVDSLDSYIAREGSAIAQLSNSKEKKIVPIFDIASKEIETDNESILSIPIGKSGTSIVEIPFGCKDDKNTFAGQCIGYIVIGQSGSGKSSFFHSLVINGCLKYSPDNLQFWLLDFKNGGASSKYRASNVPNIKIIAENNKIDDALCLFQMVSEEMNERFSIFNRYNTDNIIDYNQIANEKKLTKLPRIIIVIDEIQEVFRDDNALELNNLVSSISTRMRSAGIHMVMIAQNLSEGKVGMLKNSFMPSASGRICFRVQQDIPRDSGFGSEFYQRKEIIASLKTGEAFVEYGLGTIKKVKIAFTTAEEMNNQYFPRIANLHNDRLNSTPYVIGSKQRLSIISCLQGTNITYLNYLLESRTNTAIIGEDVYRMKPFEITFSQNQNSSLLILGSDKKIASSICTTIVLSVLSSSADIHVFNGDMTDEIIDGNKISNPLKYVCRNINSERVLIHKLSEFATILKDIYEEYIKRESIKQDANFDDELSFKPIFLVINDLFAIKSFNLNSPIGHQKENDMNTRFALQQHNSIIPGNSSELSQKVTAILLEKGWEYNINIVIAINGNLGNWKNCNAISLVRQMLLFKKVEDTGQFNNRFYIKEMLRNIENENEQETLAVWIKDNSFSKIRPILYYLDKQEEKNAVDKIVEEKSK